MKQYFDIAALEECLRVKRSTLYAWAEQGTIPHLKLGRLLRFDPDEIEAWLLTQRREAIPDRIQSRQRHRRSGNAHVDDLIAQAKRDTYTLSRGKPDQDRATGKGEDDGSV
jgi:excisionase family DNA binding protein